MNMLIKVKVFPGEKKESVVEIGDNLFEVRTRALPVNNEANRAVRLLLSEHFGFSLQEVRLIRGGRKRNKVFEVGER